MTHDRDSRSLAELSTDIDAARQAFQPTADVAFSRLASIDPEVAEALIGLFERRQAAASYIARIRFDDEPNAYATLAAGKRDSILELVAKVSRAMSGCSGFGVAVTAVA